MEIVLAKRPGLGVPDASTFDIRTLASPPKASDLKDGEVLVAVDYVSVDPAMRGWINDVRSYIPPVRIGAVMRAGGVGRVVASRYSGLEVGDTVTGMLNWQTHAIVKGKHVNKIRVTAQTPASAYLGVLGSTGLTAYFGLLNVGEPKAGEVVLVSGAAGAVGSIVCELALQRGCRVVGIAGTDDKCKWLESRGVHATVNYRSAAKNLKKALRSVCPKGVDVYFDNVGGETLDHALAMLNKKGRIVLCGAISTYNSTTAPTGPANYLSLLINSAKMQGFIVFDYMDQYAHAVGELTKLLLAGKITHTEHVVDGLENAPKAFLMLFDGVNTGKLVVRVRQQQQQQLKSSL